MPLRQTTGGLEELSNLHPERSRNTVKYVETDIAPTALNTAHVGGVNVCVLGQGFLCPISLDAQLTYSRSESRSPR